MQITLNGASQECQAENVQQLLDQLNLDRQKIVVELNGVIIAREALAETPLHAGDSLELVQFVGGG